MKTLRVFFTSFVFLSIAIIPCCFADQGTQGEAIIRVNDAAGAGTCIMPADKVTVTLRRAVLDKHSSFFGFISDSQFALTLTTTVSGSTAGETKSASFAKVVEEPVDQYNVGQIDLPQEQNVLNQFGLTNGSDVFNEIDLDISLVRGQGTSQGAKILLAAVNGTKDLAIPADPLASAFDVATSYVNNCVQPLIDQAASAKEAESYHIVMNIDAGNCSGDDARTGTIAVIYQDQNEGNPGFIDINDPDNYCFQAQLTPQFSLKYAAVPASGKCSDVSVFSILHNSYLALYVNAVPSIADAGISNPTVTPIGPKPVSTSSQFVLQSVLQNQGLSHSTSVLFSKSILSGAPISEVAKAFGIKPNEVAAFHETINRCQSNGVSVQACF